MSVMAAIAEKCRFFGLFYSLTRMAVVSVIG